MTAIIYLTSNLSLLYLWFGSKLDDFPCLSQCTQTDKDPATDVLLPKKKYIQRLSNTFPKVLYLFSISAQWRFFLPILLPCGWSVSMTVWIWSCTSWLAEASSAETLKNLSYREWAKHGRITHTTLKKQPPLLVRLYHYSFMGLLQSGLFNEMTLMYDLDSQHSSPTAELLMCLCGPPVQTALTICTPLAELQELCDMQMRWDV